MFYSRGTWSTFQITTIIAYISLPARINAASDWDPAFSFGHSIPISPDGQRIPHFDVIGHPNIFSDRILLTPPVPGGQRSAIWSDRPNHYSEWELEVPFRASGPERAGGSFHIWYTLKGVEMGTSTVYSSKPFDGLALVIDSFGGRGGSLRGFLNDGTTDYSLHHQPQALAFGHCDLAYRNLGVITVLRVTYSHQKGLKVETDGKTCFETTKVRLPENHRFGISAASADNPDSFEVFGFKLASAQRYQGDTKPPPSIPNQSHVPVPQQQQQQQQQGQSKPLQPNQSPNSQEIKYEYKDAQYTDFKTQQDQFKDVHERLQAMTHQIAEVQRVSGTIMWKLDQISSEITILQQQSPNQAIEKLEKLISAIDHQLGALDRTVKSQDVGPKIDNLHSVMREHHSNLFNSLPDTLQDALLSHGPRMGMGITILIVFQIALVALYILYKRRRANAPKKYL